MCVCVLAARLFPVVTTAHINESAPPCGALPAPSGWMNMVLLLFYSVVLEKYLCCKSVLMTQILLHWEEIFYELVSTQQQHPGFSRTARVHPRSHTSSFIIGAGSHVHMITERSRIEITRIISIQNNLLAISAETKS